MAETEKKQAYATLSSSSRAARKQTYDIEKQFPQHVSHAYGTFYGHHEKSESADDEEPSIPLLVAFTASLLIVGTFIFCSFLVVSAIME